MANWKLAFQLRMQQFVLILNIFLMLDSVVYVKMSNTAVGCLISCHPDFLPNILKAVPDMFIHCDILVGDFDPHILYSLLIFCIVFVFIFHIFLDMDIETLGV